MISTNQRNIIIQLGLILEINLRPPSTTTYPQSINNEKGVFAFGKLLVTSQVNTPKNHRKKMVESTGPNVPRKPNQSFGGGMNGIMMNTAINTPIRASPAISPADSNVPLLTNSLPDLKALWEGVPAKVPSIRKWAVLVTR